MPLEVELRDFSQRRSDGDFFFELDGHRTAAMQHFEELDGDFDANLPSHWHGTDRTPASRPTLMARLRTRKFLVVGVLVLVCLVAIFSVVMSTSWSKDSSEKPEPTEPTTPFEPEGTPVQVVAAQALTSWVPCEAIGLASKAGLPFEPQFYQSAAGSEARSPSCRQFQVPLDYQNAQGEQIIITVMRNRKPKESREGQLWLLQGGPGVPSHVLLDPIPFISSPTTEEPVGPHSSIVQKQGVPQSDFFSQKDSHSIVTVPTKKSIMKKKGTKRSRSQDTIMKNSANILARQLGLSKDYLYEWLHLSAHSFGDLMDGLFKVVTAARAEPGAWNSSS